MADVKKRVLVECAVCHVMYDVGERSARDIRAGKIKARCALHRGRWRKTAIRRAEHRRFWLDRFSMEEIQEMAVAMFPLPSQRAPSIGASLTASAAPPGPRELGGG